MTRWAPVSGLKIGATSSASLSRCSASQNASCSCLRLYRDAGIIVSLVCYRISSSPSLQPAQQWAKKVGCGRPWTREHPTHRRPTCVFQYARSAESVWGAAIARIPQGRANADVYAHILLFPDVCLRHLFLAAGCSGITEKHGSVPSELYSGRCSVLPAVREVGLKLLYALIHVVVQAKGGDTRSVILVRDVNQARKAMGLTLDEAVWDETQLLSCPSAGELLKRAKHPAEQDEVEEQALMDANRAREVLQKRLLRATSDILRGIQINLGGSGERGDASQKRLAALYESPQWHELDTCLFCYREPDLKACYLPCSIA